MAGEERGCQLPQVRVALANQRGQKDRRRGMKPLKAIGMVAGVVAMCGVFAYAGSVLSHWDEPVQANHPVAAKSSAQSAPSGLQTAAVCKPDGAL